jgi:hypothetical protein
MLNSDYKSSLDKSIQWLKGTEKFSGGSSAYSAFGLAWSKAYPETTGYIIKTLLDYDRLYTDSVSKELALRFGTWLLSIQNDNGSWNGGFHPNLKASPSVFNTAQIIIGLHALFIDSKDVIWKEAMQKAALWLSNNVNEEGFWNEGHYNDFNPTYYTRVAWPMLLANEILKENIISASALKVLDKMSSRVLSNGSFEYWGFKKDQPAFTHTIAYTIRGFIESSILIQDWDRYAKLTEPAIDRLYKFSELNGGRLPGYLDNDWRIKGNFSCLTGNAQVAYCFFLMYNQHSDLRFVNAGTKLLEYNISKQSRSGAIAGSSPIYSKYMRMRYPNWAAKFHADAIMKLDSLSL